MLLGTDEPTVDRWKADGVRADLAHDQIERISHVMAIYSCLHSVLADSPFADEWVRSPNTDFSGAAPLDRMLAEGLNGIADIRRYIETWHAGC